MDEFDASRSAARMRDAESALTGLQARFDTPGEDTYLDGNSLGLYGEDAAETLQRAVDQWRELGIEAWTEADPPWFDYGELLGDRLAGVLGAKPGECVAANSTTVNIHTLVGGFLDGFQRNDVVGLADVAAGQEVRGPFEIDRAVDPPVALPTVDLVGRRVAPIVLGHCLGTRLPSVDKYLTVNAVPIGRATA